MSNGCVTKDCVFFFNQGRGVGLHGDKSNQFFEDHCFLVESCNMLEANGYASFSDFCLFHDKGRQDQEEMVACKGHFFTQCPSTLGRQKRPRNIFLYPPIHEGPVHAPEEFHVPKGWEWPTQEAKDHLASDIALSQEDVTLGSVYPAPLRAWLIEVAIPCYFGTATHDGRSFSRFTPYEQWSVLSHLANKGACTFAADLSFELSLFGVPSEFRKLYLDFDTEARHSPCLLPDLCGNGRARCWKCTAKLVRISQSWDVPSHAQIIVRHLRMWHASACYGQDNLIGHALPVHICGADCPFKRYTSKKFDAEYHKTRDVRQPQYSNWERWEEQEAAGEEGSNLPPWRSSSQQGTSSSATRSPSTRVSKTDERLEGWF
ncbi:unnamed protein product [Polarella glacialis]|uniref:Uncharacterized protein n=1 Tax=Polarella glacialis TaxID=89957 RepID=A0A813GYB1_POLGL|nr:unnamed protein product [Polarella glacialis]